MKAKLFFVSAVTVLISTLSMASTATRSRIDILGDVVPLTATDRTVRIFPNTKYVNVTNGEAVRFVVDGNAFAWNFNGNDGVRFFDLNQVAPPGLLDHQVFMYIKRNPLYWGP